MLSLLVFLIVWFLSGYMAYGISMAVYWNEFPTLRSLPGRREELRRRATFSAIMGLSGLIAILIVNGWKYALHPIWHLSDESPE